MATMISRREGRFRSVFSFEHSGRMRHANEEHGVFAGIRRRFVKSAPGMLLEYVVNMLHARHVALANAFAINSSLNPFPYVSAASNKVIPRSNASCMSAIASPSVKFPHQPVEIVHSPKPTSLTLRSVFL